ncbi:MAG: hypothetical protein HY746_01785 [Elusimicrobia bacterium]|nr:hypothetical protein [Elusimicrobiota bacterium]
MVLIPFTAKCDQKCVFCSFEEKRPSDCGLKQWLKEAVISNERIVQVSGGEPMLCAFEDILKFVSFCASKNKTVEIQTNALLLGKTDDSMLHALIRRLNSSGGYFNVNFPADNALLDKKITGKKQGFAERKLAVLKLLRLGAVVRLTHVIFAHNYGRLPHFVRFVRRYLPGVSWIQFSFIKATGKAEGNPRLVPEYAKTAPHLQKALKLAGDSGIKSEVDHIPLCFLGRFWKKHVDAEKISRGIKGPYLREKTKIRQCGGCKFYTICSGPRLDYLEIYGRSARKIVRPVPRKPLNPRQ